MVLNLLLKIVQPQTNKYILLYKKTLGSIIIMPLKQYIFFISFYIENVIVSNTFLLLGRVISYVLRITLRYLYLYFYFERIVF